MLRRADIRTDKDVAKTEQRNRRRLLGERKAEMGRRRWKGAEREDWKSGRRQPDPDGEEKKMGERRKYRSGASDGQ